MHDLRVTWDPVTLDENGVSTNILGYRIFSSDVQIAEVGNVSQYTHNNIDPSLTYRISVAAFNSVGEGQRSGEVVVSPQQSVPAQVDGVVALIITAPPAADGSWASRSTAAGVKMATNFNVSDDLFDFAVDSASLYAWDQEIKRSGGGALRILIDDSDTTSGTDWWRFLSDDMEPFGSVESGLLDEYYLAYSVYIPQDYYNWCFDMDSSGHKKFSICSQKPSVTVNPVTRAALNFVGNPRNGSSVNNEIVVNDYGQRMHPMIYMNNPDGSARAFDFDNTPNSSDFRYSNQIDEGVKTGTPLAYSGDSRNQATRNDVARYGWHKDYASDPTQGQSRFENAAPFPDPIAAGPHWKPGWNHFKMRVKFPTTWAGTDGVLECWLGHDGDSDYTKFLSVTGTQSDGQEFICHGPSETSQSVPYNGGTDGWYHVGLWLTPFRTGGQSETGVRPSTFIGYDEVICSTNDIDFPESIVPSSIEDQAAGSILAIDDNLNDHRPEPGSGAPEGTVSQSIWDSLQGGSANWGGFINAWNGGAHDRSTGKSYIWGGGHSSYGGYEIYEFDPLTPAWTRITDPINNPGTQSESIGSGATLGPNTRHTYAGLQAWGGKYLYIEGGGLFPGVNTSNPGWAYDLVAGTWSQVTALNSYSLPSSANMTIYHPGLNELWSWRNGGATGTWVRIDGEDLSFVAAPGGGPGSNWFGDGVCDIDPWSEKIVYLGTGHAGTGTACYVWDISNPASISAYSTATTSGDTAIIGANQPGITYCDSIRKFVAWDGDGSTVARNKIVTIDATGSTLVFTEHTLTGTTPAAASVDYAGTYNRFRYDPKTDRIYGYNSITNDMYSFRLPAGA